MIKFLIERPVAVIVSFFAVMLLGITSYLKLPVSLLPDIDIPKVVVKVATPGLSAEETEERVTKVIRNGLLQLKGLQEIESKSTDGRATVYLLFDRNEDIGMSFIEINERIDMAMNGLPRHVERPIVAKTSVSDIPIFRLNIFPKEDRENSSVMAEWGGLANEVIRRRIEQIPEVAMVDITGYTKGQVELVPKQGYLESIGLDGEILVQAFRENNIELGSILVQDGHFRYFLRFTTGLSNLNTIRQTPIRVGGRLFRLSDLVAVNFVQGESNGYYYSKDKQAINLMVIKQSAARMSDFERNFGRLLKQMRIDYPDIVLELTQDQTDLLNYSIDNLQQDLLLGGMLAFFLMLIFIRKIKMAVLIGVTIPLSLIISQLGFYLFDISINVISLGGLILGLSMIIDSSIVVMDTISSYRDKGYPIIPAAVAGTNEIIRPLLTSVLTNCAVFIPLVFLGGLAGAIFYDQALSIVVGVISSFIVAIFLLPTLFALVYRKSSMTKNRWEIPVLMPVTDWYDKALHWSFKYRLLLIVFVGAITWFGISLFSILDKSRLPDITRYDFEMRIDWNEHIEATESNRRSQQIVDYFSNSVSAMNVWSGEQQYLLPILDDLTVSQSHIYIRMDQPNAIWMMSDSISKQVRSWYPEALITSMPAKNAFDEMFYDDKAPLVVKLSKADQRKTPDFDTVNHILGRLANALPNTALNKMATSQQIELRIDHTKAMLYGVSSEDIARTIVRVVGNQRIANYPAGQDLVPVVLNVAKPASLVDMLNETFVKSVYGTDIRLSALVQYTRKQGYGNIYAGSYGEYYPLTIFSSRPEFDLHLIQEELTPFEKSLDVVYDGAYFDNLSLIKEMGLVLVVSILLLYFILAAQFESLIQPLFILIELPIAICGSFLFLYLGGSSLNLMSMIGIVVMSGLIINDSILKIDAINQLRNQGTPLKQAIFEGGHKRLRSIVMISLTSIGALCPTLFMNDLGSELQKPLALALIGGMVVGLFVSLYFVPIIYWYIYRKEDKK